MDFNSITVRKTINKAFLKEPVERGSFTVFKDALEQLLDAIEVAKGKNEHEEHFKNFWVSFFNNVGFADYFINTSACIDLAIYTGIKGKGPVGVLIEAKRPGNSPQVLSEQKTDLENKVDQILAAKKENPEIDTNELEAEIDRMVYEFYGLSEEEIGVVEGALNSVN